MCHPAAAIAIPLIAGAIGGGIGLYGGIREGQAAADEKAQVAENYRGAALQAEREADIEKQVSKYEADRTKDTVKRTLGAQRAGMAANGIALNGSAADVLDDTAREGALDIAAIQWNSSMRQDTLKHEAKVQRVNAEAADRSRAGAFQAPVINGVARLVGSFG